MVDVPTRKPSLWVTLIILAMLASHSSLGVLGFASDTFILLQNVSPCVLEL